MQTYVFEKNKEGGSTVHTINCKRGGSWVHHPIAEPQTSRTIIISQTLNLEQMKDKALKEDANLIPLRVCKDCSAGLNAHSS